MNIFILDEDQKLAAKYHCDKHVIKMILESAQLMSTAINIKSNNNVDNLYKTTHINHPCSKWTRESKQNFDWLLELFNQLCIEYTNRYKKIHKCQSMLNIFKQHSHLFPNIGRTPFVLAMPEQFKSEYDGFDYNHGFQKTNYAVSAYRIYYAASKYKFAKWTKWHTYSELQNCPYWWNVYRSYVITNNLEVVNDKNDYVKV